MRRMGHWLATVLVSLGLLAMDPPVPATAQSLDTTMGDQIIAAAIIEGTPWLAVLALHGPLRQGPKATWLLLVDLDRGRIDHQIELPGAANALAVDPVRQRVYLVANASSNARNPLLRYDRPTPTPAAPPSNDATPRRTFPETGATLGWPFLATWEAHGGVASLGYPITDAIVEQQPGDYRRFVTQYFERAMVWLDEDPLMPADGVQIEALGVQFAATRALLPAPTIASPERLWFPEAGHSVAYGFKRFWEARGGLAVFGYPITEEFTAVSPGDGVTRTVQYFERARFEYHPEYQHTPHEVQLGLLGRQVLTARGWFQ
ncbi:MAG: hypothetical protein IT340_18285 [Chloroflexi bacterium]|nr:hypothetical protein [Chloroflexota bacterium]